MELEKLEKKESKSLNFKIIGIFILMFFLLVTLNIIITISSIKKRAYSDLNERVNVVEKISLEYINSKYQGDWYIKDNKLYKGDKLINNETEVIDKIQELTDAYVTIFLNDTRIATNVKNNNERIIGTKASDEVKETVLIKSNEYIGKVDIQGNPYITKYVPLKNSNNETIGMYFVGVSEEGISRYITQSIIKLLIISLILLISSTFIYIIIIKKIVKDIKIILSSIKKIEQGNLQDNCVIDSKDEISVIANGINKMQGNIKNLIRKIQDTSNIAENTIEDIKVSSNQLGTSIEEVTKTIGEIANSTSDQAQLTQEGMSKTEELSKSIILVSESVNEISNEFKHTYELSDKGLETVKKLTIKSQENNEESLKIAKIIEEFDKHSQEIGYIVSTIQSIAEQTNLLSLNASIESARAGEAGRGFAVVASEIRKLAEQSAKATSEIKVIINNIQNQSKLAVKTIEGSKTIINEQDIAVKKTEEVFKEINNSIKVTQDNLNTISDLNKNMVNNKDIIVSVMENISAFSEETSASTEEISASTEEQNASVIEFINSIEGLSQTITLLNEEIDKFKV